MGYADNRGDYWRGRYKIEPGKYGTVADEHGKTIRFRTKRAAEKAAAVEEERVLTASQAPTAPQPDRITFGAYASRWYAVQDLAASTMQNYRRHIEEHLLPEFEDAVVSEITPGRSMHGTAASAAAGTPREASRPGGPPCT